MMEHHHANKKVNLLRAREAELERLMQALSPPRRTTNAKTTTTAAAPTTTTTTAAASAAMEQKKKQTKTDTTTRTTTTTTTSTTPQAAAPPPVVEHSRPPRVPPASNSQPPQRSLHENHKQVRNAFRYTNKDTSSTSTALPYTKSEKIKFERAHQRRLQGHATTIVLPSHPVLQLHRTHASGNTQPTVVPIQLLNPAHFQKNRIPLSTKSRGSQTKPRVVAPVPKPVATVTIEVQTESHLLEEPIPLPTPTPPTPPTPPPPPTPVPPVQVITEPPPSPVVPEIRVHIPPAPVQLEEWELRELGPMLLPPEVMLHFGSIGERDEKRKNTIPHARTLVDYVHVADLTKEDMPPALFQPPPSVWEQQHLQRQRSRETESKSNHTTHQGDVQPPIVPAANDFFLGEHHHHSNNQDAKIAHKYDRDPFAYWKQHRSTAMRGGAPGGGMQDVEQRFLNLEQDFEHSEETLKKLEDIIQYEEEHWGLDGNGGSGEVVDDGDSRARYLRYEQARSGNTSGTSGRAVSAASAINVNELERDVGEARDLMTQLEALVGLEEEEYEGGGTGEDAGTDEDQRDEDVDSRNSRGGDRLQRDGKRMRYAGQGEWTSTLGTSRVGGSSVRSSNVVRGTRRNAPSPSKVVPTKEEARRLRIEKRKSLASSGESSINRKKIDGIRPQGIRRTRIPRTMTRRSHEVITRGGGGGRRRGSVGTRVHKGVERLNQANSISNRISAALDLARNVV